MDSQYIINFILGALFTINCSLLGVLYSAITARITRVEESLSKVEDKSNLLEVLVSGKYMLREEALETNAKLFSKLDEIQKSITECRLEHHKRRETDGHNS